MKLVSCICPSKRSPVDLERTIDNFLAQTYPCKELVILRSGPGPLPRGSYGPDGIINFVPANLSIGELRNVAIRISRGSVIAHWDDDDISHHERLTRSMAAIDAGAMLVGSSRVIYEGGKCRPASSVEDCDNELKWSCPFCMETTTHCSNRTCKVSHYKEQRYLFDGAALTPKYLVGGTLVYRRELWERRKFEDVNQGEDTRFQYACYYEYMDRASRIPFGSGEFADLADESLYTARISSDATSPKDVESPGWKELP